MTVGTSVDVEVGKVAHGGVCVAHAPDGRVVFVRHALPGERVRVVVTEARARYLRADAVETLVPSPDRVPAPCPYAGPGRCGGCDWQHATPGAQRLLKAAVVREQLSRLAGVDVDVEVEPVPGSDDGLGWRTRMQFSVRPDGVVGLHRHRSYDIEPIRRCLIAHPLVEDLGVERHRWPGAEGVDVAVGAVTGDRAVVVTPRRADGGDPDRSLRVPPLDAGTSLLQAGPRGRVTRVRGRRGVREVAVGRTWRVTASGFWQVHWAAADALANAVLEALHPRPGESGLDLYAGVGLFAGVLSAQGVRMTAVESDPHAAMDARYNLRDFATADVRRGRVVDVLRDATLRPDVVVLDPPRAGAGTDVARWLAGSSARAAAYVACDPAGLARDVGELRRHGWAMTGLRAFDIFPMTAHVECVARLEPLGRSALT